jgi:large subunit ribosomal protein L29
MKSKEIKGKNKADLQKLLSEKRQALHGFRFGIAGSKVRNMKEGKNIRKDIARIMTEMNSKANSK